MYELKFNEWLLDQNDRTDAVGDLACDVCKDPQWPTTGDPSFRVLADYLQLKAGGDPAVVRALYIAWCEWSEQAFGEVRPPS